MRSTQLLAMLFFFVVVNFPLWSAEYYIDAESRGGPADDANPGTMQKPWKTLSRIVTDKEPYPGSGDTVLIRGGVYRESLALKRGGTEKQPLILKAYPGEEAIIDGEGKRMSGIFLSAESAADNVVIDGLSIRNLNRQGIQSVWTENGSGVMVVKRKNIALRNLVIDHACHGIYLLGTHNVKVTGCRIANCRNHGILACAHVLGSSDLEIADNTIANIGWDPNVPGKEKGDSDEGDGIRVSGYGDMPGACGIPGKIESAGKSLARFQITDSKTGEILKLNFMRHPGWDVSGLCGQNAEGTVKYPTVLYLFYSATPKYLDDKFIPGGRFKAAVGYTGFPLRNNPEWNDKPYSPDEKWGLCEIGDATVEEMAKAKYAFMKYAFPPEKVTVNDCKILRNTVSDTWRQGILVGVCHNVIIEGNTTHHCGATGIQVEGSCRNFLVRRNISFANSYHSGAETGIWIWGAENAVVEDNSCFENPIGLWIGKSQMILARRNHLYNNSAQHVNAAMVRSMQMKSFPSLANVSVDQFRKAQIERGGEGILVTGHDTGVHLVECPWETSDVAILHNTIFDNGCPTSGYGTGATIGFPSMTGVQGTLFLNNIVADGRGRYAVMMLDTSACLDGNLYARNGSCTMFCKTGPARWLGGLPDGNLTDVIQYDLSDTAAFDKYRQEKKQDGHSLFVNSALLGDFALSKDSPAIDRAVPLARTTSGGKGRVVPVDRPRCFSDGFRTSQGEVLVPGDEIVISGKKARIVSIDWEKSHLIVAEDVAWGNGDPVSYPYLGAGADIGARECR